MTPNSEYQKPFSKIGHLNATIITDKTLSEEERNKLKRKVNQLMKRDFYTNVPGEKND